MSKYNPNQINDNAAHLYDVVYNDWINNELTKKETEYIVSLIPQGGSVMDLGCGTGRHLIEIAKNGIDITGVDISENMLLELKKKYPQANVLKANIYTDTIDQKFDLITLIWNAVMEIAYTDENLALLFTKLKSLLKPNGKILIVNLYTESNSADTGLNFSETKEKDGIKYRLSWKVNNFDKDTNTTLCEEKIEVLDNKDQPEQTVISDIKQKWWKKAELEKAGQELGFSLTETSLSGSDYHYYLFEE